MSRQHRRLTLNSEETEKSLATVSLDDGAILDDDGDGKVDDSGAPMSGVGPGATSPIEIFSADSKKGYQPYNPSKKNQDSFCHAHDAKSNSTIFAVFDGHGEVGDLVSHYITDRLTERMLSHSEWPKNPAQVMIDTLHELEAELNAMKGIDTDLSGTTAVLCVVQGALLTVANVGDSRIIVGAEDSAKKLYPKEVSIDHKPELPEEKARITSVGGRVFAVQYDDGVAGPARVWLKHMDVPGLAMSRSLCDEVAHTAGVISDPQIHEYVLQDEDRFFVMATDGLWEFMSNEEVCRYVELYKDSDEAVQRMIAESTQRWMKEEQVVDDTTVILCHVTKPATE